MEGWLDEWKDEWKDGWMDEAGGGKEKKVHQ